MSTHIIIHRSSNWRGSKEPQMYI